MLTELKSLLLLGIRLGVAYVDLQLTAPNELIEEISSKKGFTRVIGTYQDINGELKWNNVEWKNKYNQGVSMNADIVRLVGKANSIQDNLDLENFKKQNTLKS